MGCCTDMKEGQVYYCADCGVELKVIASCSHEGGDACSVDECKLMCCGEEMKLKEAE